MSVTLANKSGAPLTLHLPHAQYCAARGVCGCGRTRGADVNVLIRVPESLHMSAGEIISGVHDAVLRCPDVRDAIQKGDLKVIENAQPVAATPLRKKDEQKAKAPATPPAAPATKMKEA